MKPYAKPLVIGLACLSIAAPGPLFAEEPPPPGPGAFGGGHGGPWGEHGGQRLEERLTRLQKELKLTPAQEADWKTFSDKARQARAERREARPDFAALKQLPAPERLEKMIEWGKARLAGLEEMLAATKTFYATLTPEQRKTFDDLTPFGEQGPKWGHGGKRRHGGPR